MPKSEIKDSETTTDKLLASLHKEREEKMKNSYVYYNDKSKLTQETEPKIGHKIYEYREPSECSDNFGERPEQNSCED